MIDLIIDRRGHDLGGGLQVGRILPYAKQRMVGPFIFLDHLGPVDLPPGLSRSLDVRPHPHIGLSTVTYLFDGRITHRDSVGCRQEIQPEEVNWMVAGRGITHSERFDHARLHGAHMHGVQAWVALPVEHEETEPAFHHHAGDFALPVWRETGVRGRLIAGAAFGLTAEVRVHSPLFYIHWHLGDAARVTVPGEYTERAIYVVRGEIDVAGRALHAGQMAVLSPAADAEIRATGPATVMALGGEPVGQRFMFWNLVSSSKERLEEAKLDWRLGRMKLPDGDDQEFIPLPEETPEHATSRHAG